jgi:hypothetical protein
VNTCLKEQSTDRDRAMSCETRTAVPRTLVAKIGSSTAGAETKCAEREVKWRVFVFLVFNDMHEHLIFMHVK